MDVFGMGQATVATICNSACGQARARSHAVAGGVIAVVKEAGVLK